MKTIRWFQHFVTLVIVAAVVGLVLQGCAIQPRNTDPRKGTVYLDEDACDGLKIGPFKTWGCDGATKVCVGPDLRFAAPWDEKVKIIRNSQECKP